MFLCSPDGIDMTEKSVSGRFQLSKLLVKANFDFEPLVGNPTTGMKSDQKMVKFSNKKPISAAVFVARPVCKPVCKPVCTCITVGYLATAEGN